MIFFVVDIIICLMEIRYLLEEHSFIFLGEVVTEHHTYLIGQRKNKLTGLSLKTGDSKIGIK